MTDKVQKIRKEVEKLKSQLLRGACSSQVAMETRCKEEAYNDVLAILDSMQEEPASEDLEEAAEAWSHNDDNTGSCDYIGVTVCEYAFKAGAQWHKEQMMAKAIDGKIYETQARSKLKAVTTGNLSRLDYKVGDKVKVIVIKED